MIKTLPTSSRLKPIAFAVAALFSNHTFAAENFYPVGANWGYGDASTKNTIFSVSVNPAMVGSNLYKENNYGIGITGGVLITQQGADQVIDQYKNKVEPILQEMDNNNGNALNLAQDLQTELNNLVLTSRDSFRTNFAATTSIPLQIAHSSFGAIGLEISAYAEGQERLLSSNKPVALDTQYLLANPNATTNDIINNGLILQTALYTKTAQFAEAALTYAYQFYAHPYLAVRNMQLTGALRVKYMQAKLRKNINSLAQLLTSDNDVGQQVADDIQETLGSGEAETQIGVDLGFMLNHRYGLLGLTVYNINSPTFTYNTLGVGTDIQAQTEQFYSDQIALKETVTLDPQAKLTAAVHTSGKQLMLSGSIDLNEANNLLNNPYQWASVALSYSSSISDAWWYMFVPDIRLSYRTNLADSEQSYITTGLTFGVLNIDITFSDLDSLQNVSEDNIPKGLGLQAGLELQF